MNKRTAALGRGLDALFAETEVQGELRQIPLDQLQRGAYQPRRQFDPETLAELAASIRAEGVLQPIVVRAVGDRRFEILAGERRWRAAQLAELTQIPALVRHCSDQQALAIGLIENIQRAALNPMEEAAALERLLTEFQLSHDALAASLGRSRAAISNQLRLLRLDPGVAAELEKGALSAGHGRALVTLAPPRQRQVAQQILARALNVRQTEELVRRQQAEPPAPRVRSVDPDRAALAAQLSADLGVEVDLLQGRGGRGELRLRWRDAEQAAALWARLGLPSIDDELASDLGTTEDSVPQA